jgi:hypothetical protein
MHLPAIQSQVFDAEGSIESAAIGENYGFIIHDSHLFKELKN